MKTVFWDIETRSTIDLRAVGVYRYAKHASTEVLLAAWAVDDGPVKWARVDDPAIEELKQAFAQPDVRIVAHNAGFERLLLKHVLAERHGWSVPGIDQWDCTAARAARQALPRSLDGAANALGLAVTKDREGHALMMRMCKPRPARKGEPDNAVLWFDDDERMERLGAYCATDVEVERLLDQVLRPMPDDERRVWQLTELVNDRGVPVDLKFASMAQMFAHDVQAELNHRIRTLTDGLVPAATNLPRLREWLSTKFGVAVLEHPDDELTKRAIEMLLSREELPEVAREALQIRLDAGKSSVKKFQAIVERTDDDHRVRGNLVYHGASTGRYAGAGVQLQNLPRKTVKDFDAVADDVRNLSITEFNHKYGSPLDVLSKTLRATICTKPELGTTLLWADYAAVEARGVAWLAGADQLVNLFASGGKVYEEMAATIFDCHASQIKDGSVERFIGKTVVLGCGYGMGKDKFRATCELQGQTITPELAERAVKAYREAHPEIPALWRGVEEAAIAAVQSPGNSTSYNQISFRMDRKWLLMRLPSGRVIYYRNPRVVLVQGMWGERLVLEYDAVNSLTKQWGSEKTWGGKLVENAVQGLCRCMMTAAMLALEEAGYPVVMSVHDEIICEVADEDLMSGKSIEQMVEIMCRVPAWAKDFPLKAEGKQGKRYGK